MVKNVSPSTENFIKVIYKLEKGKGWDTRPGSIAKELGITNAAATDMARKLSAKKLVNYKKYKSLSLTPEGQKLALHIIRKHRLWETFLHEVFDLSMHEIHREAEILEHLTSDFMIEKISQYLGHPTTDPHGDPIPDSDGSLPFDENNIFLSMAEEEKTYEISRLSGSDKEFFDFCLSNQLKVGTELTVLKQYQKNKMFSIEIEGTGLLIHEELANIIYVKERA